MQQTTCGVTPKKTKVFNRNVVVDFLKENEQLFKDLNDSQYCLYDSNKLVSDHALNYLNSYWTFLLENLPIMKCIDDFQVNH